MSLSFRVFKLVVVVSLIASTIGRVLAVSMTTRSLPAIQPLMKTRLSGTIRKINYSSGYYDGSYEI